MEQINNYKPHCEICGITQQLSRCGKCKTAYYCTTAHQRLDWSKHKQSCRLLAKHKLNDFQQLQEAVAAIDTPQIQILQHSSSSSSSPSSIITQKNCVNGHFGDCHELNGCGLCNCNSNYNNKTIDSMSVMLNTNNLNNFRLINNSSQLNGTISMLTTNNSDNLNSLYTALNNQSQQQYLNERNNIQQQPYIYQPLEKVETKDHNHHHHHHHHHHHQQQQQQQQPQQQPYFNYANHQINQMEKNSSYQIGENSIGSAATERRYEELCRNIINDMNEYGLSVVDDFLGIEKGLKVLNEVLKMHTAGVFTDGQLVNNTIGEQTSRTIRGDKITWLKGIESGCENVGYLINQIDNVIFRANTMQHNGKLGNYNIRERTKAMVACYPGSGSHYIKHIDNPNRDGRVITAIYYLNDNWNVERDGGILRICPENCDSFADIAPKFDRLIFFWSDKRNPHEVQPAHRTRYAITVWYFDANERLAALNRCKYEKSATVISGSGGGGGGVGGGVGVGVSGGRVSAAQLSQHLNMTNLNGGGQQMMTTSSTTQSPSTIATSSHRTVTTTTPNANLNQLKNNTNEICT